MSQPGNHDMPRAKPLKEISLEERLDLNIYKQMDGYVAVRIRGDRHRGPEYVFSDFPSLHKWLGEELSLRFKGTM